MVWALGGGAGENRKASWSRGTEMTLTGLCFHGRAS